MTWLHELWCRQASWRPKKQSAFHDETPRRNDANTVARGKAADLGRHSCEHSCTVLRCCSNSWTVGLTRLDGKRSDGLALIPWQHGKSLTWDVTVVSTLADSYLHVTSHSAGGAAETASVQESKYSALPSDYRISSNRSPSSISARQAADEKFNAIISGSSHIAQSSAISATSFSKYGSVDKTCAPARK